MAGSIVLFGATGYTGGLVAEELAARRAGAVLAGRRPAALDAMRDGLGDGFEVQVADTGDPASVAALVGLGDILISTVGPFARHGRPAVDAAVQRRAHYIDSTGEPAFVRTVFDDFGLRAQRAGVVLLPAFGFDCVPGHVAAAMALEDAGPAAVQVDVGYFSHGGRPSGGTLASLMGAARAPSFAWRDGALLTERGGAHTALFDLGDRRARGLSFGGSEHLALPRSYPRLREVGTYIGWFGPLTRAAKAAGAGRTIVEKLPGVPRLLDRAIGRLAPGSTGGPDGPARARSSSTIVAVARDASGRELATVRLRGVDGYTLTGRLIAWAAIELRDGASPPPGARGPVEAFGLDTMARALAAAGLPRVD
jgi:short subunit dehydrogenase-like uncharacterized protein